MAVIEEDEVEILVHIAASSKATDDTRYRAFATAYLRFEPVVIHDNVKQSSDELFESPQRSGERARSGWSSSERSMQLPSLPGMSTLSNRTPYTFKSPDASFKSISDNLDTPRFYGRTPHQLHRSNLSSNAGTASSPTACLQTNFGPSSFGDSRLPSTTEVYEDFLAMEASTSHMKSSTEYPASSLELPTLPRQRSRLVQPEEEEEPESDDISSSRPVNFHLSSMTVPKQIEKRKSTTELPQPLQKRQRQIVSGQNLTNTRTKAVARIEKNPTTAVLCKVPNELRPPLPEASISHMTTLDILTPYLVDLESSGMFKSWRSAIVNRELRPLERGYWYMNYSTWNVGEQSWRLLNDYTRKGMLGWGVSCVKFSEKKELRTYCWGGIVKHIFFVLRIVSYGGVKATGGTWFDGDGVAVITVPPDNTAPRNVEVGLKPIK